MSIYYHDTPKPLALYRDRIRTGWPAADAKLELYKSLWRRWAHNKGRHDLFMRHIGRVIEIANREADHERHHRAA